MSDTPLSPEEDDVALAGEFALRLLSGDEEKQAMERAKTDPKFAALVANWESQLSQLADQIEDVPPRQVLKSELMKRAFGETPPSFWDRYRILLSGVVAASAIAVAVLVGTQLFPAEQPTYVAEIMAEDGSIAVTASYFRESKDVLVEVTAGAAPEGRVLQVWGILERQAPVPIGVIPATGKGRF